MFKLLMGGHEGPRTDGREGSFDVAKWKGKSDAVRRHVEHRHRALAQARGNVRVMAEVTEDAVAKFSELMRQRILEGDTPARKAWLTSIVDRIEVDEGIVRLYGRKDVLEQCVIAGTVATARVRTFVPEWRTRQDSNL